MALVNVHQLAKHLSIKPKTLYQWAATGQIPSLKIHGVVRFNLEEIDEWLKSFRKEKPKKTYFTHQNYGGNDQEYIKSVVEKASEEAYNSAGKRENHALISSPRKGGKTHGAV